MHILVNLIEAETETDKEKLLKKTKEIICPECKETCKIDMDDYVISLFGCKEKHEKDYIEYHCIIKRNGYGSSEESDSSHAE